MQVDTVPTEQRPPEMTGAHPTLGGVQYSPELPLDAVDPEEVIVMGKAKQPRTARVPWFFIGVSFLPSVAAGVTMAV